MRERFKVYEAACERRDELLDQDNDREALVAFRRTRLTARQLRDAETAVFCLGEAFRGERWPLCRAVQVAKKEIKRRAPSHIEMEDERKWVSQTISQLIEPYLAEQRTAGRRTDTIRNLRSRVGLLGRVLGDPVPRQVTWKNVEMVLNRQSDPTTWDNDRRAFSAFFSWCMEQEPPLCSENPARKRRRSHRPTSDEKEPVALLLRQVRRLLAAAAAFNNGELIPYIVLGLFCALRPREAARILRKDIYMKRRHIEIRSAVAKLRQKRLVKIPAVALAWLRLYLKRGVIIYPKNWRKKFDIVKRMAGFGTPSKQNPKLTPWPQNALRRTAISHWLAATGNEITTATWAGTSPEMLHKYYKVLVWPTDSKVFWQLKPDKVLGRKSGRRLV